MHWLVLPIGIAIGVLAAVSIFGRRVQRSVYSKAEGQPGAAGWALDNMRGSWRVTPGVAGTTHLDAVHRVIGRPGVILVAEGAPHRVKGLLAQEKKRHARVVGKTPIYDIVVGNDEGQVPLGKLQRHVMKLPRNISAKRDGHARGPARRARLPGGRRDAEGPAARPARRCAACSARSAAADLPGRDARDGVESTPGADDDRGGRAVVPAPAVGVADQRRQHQREQRRAQHQPAAQPTSVRPRPAPPACPARPCPA